MIEMVDENLPTVEMRILKNGRVVVEVKVTGEDSGKGCQSERADHDEHYRWVDL